MSDPPNALSDPARAAIAWARYRRMLRLVALTAVGSIILAFVYLSWGGASVPIHMAIATVAGVGGTVMLGGALMLLVFLSAGSGHDDDAAHGGADER